MKVNGETTNNMVPDFRLSQIDLNTQESFSMENGTEMAYLKLRWGVSTGETGKKVKWMAKARFRRLMGIFMRVTGEVLLNKAKVS